MREAIRIYRERLRADGGSPRGTLWYQSPFRSDNEGIWFMGLALWVALPAGILAAIFEWSLLVRVLAMLLAAALWWAGWFVWIVWGRDAFPLPDKDQLPERRPDPPPDSGGTT